MKRRKTLISTRIGATLALSLALCAAASAQSLPQVHLDADGLAPRSIEQLTGTSIVRYYSEAWHTMEFALESSRADGLGEQFNGFAKERLIKRIADQNQTGVHIRIVDHGHQFKAIFYSSDGTAMQLIDRAQLEIQTYDGGKLLDSESVPHEYLVIMTPGADRWYVRDLEEIPAK